jgi:hypothetical protein
MEGFNISDEELNPFQREFYSREELETEGILPTDDLVKKSE